MRNTSTMATNLSFGWVKDPRGFLKVLILLTNVLSLAFFVEGVGFLNIPEFRLYFIVTGGYVLILSYRILSYIFAGRLTSGPEEVLADIVGALLLVSLPLLLVIRGGNETGYFVTASQNTSTAILTPPSVGVALSPEEVEQKWILIFVSAGCGILAGITLAIDACFVIRLPS